MKRLLGVVGLLLGLVGTAASIAGAIVIWPETNHYAQEALTLCTEIETTVQSTQGIVDPFEVRIQRVVQEIAGVRQSATVVAREGDASDPADRAKVKAILAELTAILERAEGWTDTVQSAAHSLNSVLKLATAVTWKEQQKQKLQKTVDALEQIDTTLDRVRVTLARAKQETNLQTQAGHLANVASALESPLSRLDARVGDVSTFLSQARADLTSIQETIAFWKTWLPPIATFVLFWIGLGQVCLIRWSWNACRPAKNDLDRACSSSSNSL